jgi:hypothetical protein
MPQKQKEPSLKQKKTGSPMKIQWFLIVLFSTNIMFGQVSFEAKPSKTTLGVNERLRVDFVMNQDGDNFSPPDFVNFKVVGGPSQSINNSWINGVRSFSKSYTYFLAPKKSGVFTIGQSTIEIDGEVYKTSPIKITVTAAVDIPKDPNDPNYIASESIHLVAEVSKTNPYLNEAISVVYKLYVAENTGVRNWSEIDTPRYNDFWSQNIEVKGLSVKEGQYKGENYRYVVLKKAVLFPQKTGKLSIEPLALDVSVEVPSNRRDIFGRLTTTTTNRTVTAGRRTINVKPLPEKNKPDDFSGAVGEFDFNAVASKTSLIASEAFALRLEVTGKGNLKLFEIPKPSLPATLEVFEPEHKENISTLISGMRGSISDNYTIVPNEQGQYPIPTLSFSYFDLKSKSYKTIKSKQVVISVAADPTSANTPTVSKSLNSAENASPADRFSSFKTETSLQPIQEKPFHGTPLFWVLFLGPIILIPLTIMITKKQRNSAMDVEGNKIKQNNKLARKYLSEAKSRIGEKERFYEALDRALHKYLKAKLRLETSDISKDKIRELLENKGVVKDNINTFIEVLQSCEIARYTPLVAADMKRDYSIALEAIGALDKHLK